MLQQPMVVHKVAGMCKFVGFKSLTKQKDSSGHSVAEDLEYPEPLVG